MQRCKSKNECKQCKGVKVLDSNRLQPNGFHAQSKITLKKKDREGLQFTHRIIIELPVSNKTYN